MRQHTHFLRLAFILAAVAFLAAPLARAQQTTATRPMANPARGRGMRGAGGGGAASPEVHADRTVTFRLRAPQATQVSVSGEFPGNHPMTKDAQGVWSVTVGPLDAKIYDYGFSVDGLRMLDPANSSFKNQTTSLLLVPGEKPALHELRPVPHGAVTMHWYESKSVGVTRRIFVYTPPDYGKEPAKKFPVFYLLHGSGDNESMWTLSGKANLMLDNLLADGKAQPMIIVMPYGHTPGPATAAGGARGGRGGLANTIFENDLLKDVMPLVEASYRVYTDPAHRAIAGLSMGGGQSSSIGLNHPELFGYVGIWSPAVPNLETGFQAMLAKKGEQEKNLKLVWIGCGKDDTVVGFARSQAFSEWLTAHGVKNTWRPSEGAHQWPVWRMYLGEFLPLLFQEK